MGEVFQHKKIHFKKWFALFSDTNFWRNSTDQFSKSDSHFKEAFHSLRFFWSCFSYPIEINGQNHVHSSIF